MHAPSPRVRPSGANTYARMLGQIAILFVASPAAAEGQRYRADASTLCNLGLPDNASNFDMRALVPTLLCASVMSSEAAIPKSWDSGTRRGTRGYYIELGAYNGITHSNTLLLESCFGWDGTLIEGNPRNFHLLKTHSGRGGSLLHSAISSDCRDGKVNYTNAGGEISGVAADLLPMLHGYRASTIGRGGISTVPCTTLGAVLETAGMDELDLLSLDVEGHEVPVLQTMANLSAIKVAVIEIAGSQKKREQIESLLSRAGLQRVEALEVAAQKGRGANDVYVRADVLKRCHTPVYRWGTPMAWARHGSRARSVLVGDDESM